MLIAATQDAWSGTWDAAGGWLAGMALLAAAALLLLWRWWSAVGAGQVRRTSRLRRLSGDAGTATIEFTLVFPILLVIVLLLIQTTLAFTGQLFVNYAAFAAARKAIVEVPRDLGGDETRNRVASSSSQKRENIRGIAAFALMPVSGPGVGTGALGERQVGQAVDSLYSAEGLDSPRWSEDLVDRRLSYALAYTDVTIERVLDSLDPIRPDSDGVGYVAVSPGSPQSPGWRFGPRDPIRVVVRHRLHLSIPYVGRLLGNGVHTVDDRSSAYREMTGDFMLTNEGVSRTLPANPADSDKPRT